MNDFAELEAELKKLRPAVANAELITRVEQSLGSGVERTAGAGVLPQPRKPRVSWFSLGLGFAAAAVLLLLARPYFESAPQKQPTLAAAKPATSPARSVSAQSFVPDGLTRVVYNRSDEGLVFPSAAETPLRRVRSRSRETLQWKNPDTGASLRVSYPTDEVEFIPVAVQ